MSRSCQCLDEAERLLNLRGVASCARDWYLSCHRLAHGDMGCLVSELPLSDLAVQALLPQARAECFAVIHTGVWCEQSWMPSAAVTPWYTISPSGCELLAHRLPRLTGHPTKPRFRDAFSVVEREPALHRPVDRRIVAECTENHVLIHRVMRETCVATLAATAGLGVRCHQEPPYDCFRGRY